MTEGRLSEISQKGENDKARSSVGSETTSGNAVSSQTITPTESASSELPETLTETPLIEAEKEENTQEETEVKLQLQVGDSIFTATFESNAAVDELIGMMQQAPVVIEMSDYSGVEKVGSLGESLTTSNSRTTTHAGDIVLYNGNQIVIFQAPIPGAIPGLPKLMI